MKKSKKKYATNKEILEELKLYHDTDIISEKLHFIFYNMCLGISNKPNFVNYTFREDMSSDAYQKCLKVVAKFDMSRNNPFTYFSTVIHNVFYDALKKYKREQDIKELLQERLYDDVINRHSKVIDIRGFFDTSDETDNDNM